MKCEGYKLYVGSRATPISAVTDLAFAACVAQDKLVHQIIERQAIFKKTTSQVVVVTSHPGGIHTLTLTQTSLEELLREKNIQ